MRAESEDNRLYNLEMFISRLLRYGVILAGVLLAIGWASRLHFSSAELLGNPFAMFATYHQHPMVETLSLLWSNRDWGLLTGYAGLVVLISLPFLRVIMTAFLFFKQKEFVLGAVATFVCIALVVSVLLGFEI